MNLPTKGTLWKKDQTRTSVMFMQFFSRIFFIKAYVVGTHLNCIDRAIHFIGIPTTYDFMKK